MCFYFVAHAEALTSIMVLLKQDWWVFLDCHNCNQGNMLYLLEIITNILRDILADSEIQ